MAKAEALDAMGESQTAMELMDRLSDPGRVLSVQTVEDRHPVINQIDLL
jgi:hypothetical protein